MAAVRQIRRSRVLAAGRARAWRALTEPDLAASWLGAAGALDLRTAGSRALLTEPDGTVREVVVEEVDPGRRLVLRWSGRHGSVTEPSRVELALDDHGDGTRVTVTEIALADAVAAGGAR